MRRFVGLTLVAGLTAFALGCGGDPPGPPVGAAPEGLTVHRQAAGEPGPDGWYEARSTRGGFAVRLPGPFNDFTRQGQDGGRAVHAVGLTTPRGVRYLALAMSSAGEPPTSGLGGLAAAAERDGTLAGRREVVWEGRRGTELYLKRAATMAKVRTYEAGGMRYTLIAEFPPDAEPDVLPDVDKFLGSLRSVE